MSYIDDIKAYIPDDELEEQDKIVMLKYIEKFPDILFRTNEVAHMTSSSWIINKDRTKILMHFHNIYNSWSWTGGHADGEENMLLTAIKEAKEETGVKTIKPILNDIYSIEILTVDSHIKKGKWVSSHLHFNVTYLLEADDKEELHINKDENKAVSWIPIEKVNDYCSEECMKKIYTKLNSKIEKKVI